MASRAAAANRLIQRINEWYSSVPLHLGSIRPSLLIPSYRRQAIVLKLAHSHAIIHAVRPFVLENSPSGSIYTEDLLVATKTILETVNQIASEGTIFRAFWWTHYVAFCALVVVYVWDIQVGQVSRLGDEASSFRKSRRNLL